MKNHTLKDWIFAVRPWSVPASAMPIVVSVVYLFYKGHQIDWLMGLWTLAGMVLFHLAGNVWSDYFDYIRKVDADDTYGAKTLTTGMFEPSEIRNFAIGLLVAAIACGLGLTIFAGVELLYIGIAGAVLTVLYPFLKYHALGDLDILLTFAFLPTIGTSLTTVGLIDWSVLWIALPVGLITDGILHSNNTRDTASDKRAEIKTMAMGLGHRLSAYIYGFEMIFPFVWVAVLSLSGVLPHTTVFVFLTLPIAVGCARTMIYSVTGGKSIIADLDVRTANLQLMFSMILTVSLVVGKFV